jgi:hypothetical protein
MVRHELRVEQFEAAREEARHQVNQCDFAGVARCGEHALAEEGAPQRDAIEPTHQMSVQPSFNAMRLARRMEFKA